MGNIADRLPHSGNWFSFLILFFASPLLAQTDETIFREFQFDFSTPGARANGMGRAFVGLADEATAAYNNPAGLSVLQKPEFSIEYRFNQSEFDALKANETFDILQSAPEDTTFNLERVGFASYAFSRHGYNFSLFYVNNLDYRRKPVADRVELTNLDEGYTGTYLNTHNVRQIRLNTYGFSVSKDFGRLDLGVAIAMANLKTDFEYSTSLFVRNVLDNLITSEGQGNSYKAAYVFGANYQLHPKVKLGLAYKHQPRFTYTEEVQNNEFSSSPESIPVNIKIPDSYQIGLAVAPNDYLTLLMDVDWVRYDQLIGENMTVLSRVNIFFPPGTDLFTFDQDDFEISRKPEIHLGGEYLLPWKSHIWAFRAGLFFDPDHKTRFVGTPEEGEEPILFDIQSFIFNPQERNDDIGTTLGLGYVWGGKMQFDIALVQSDRFRRVVTSFLYRF